MMVVASNQGQISGKRSSLIRKSPLRSSVENHQSESDLALLIHIAIPFFIGGIGTCFAGVIFHEVQNYAVFRGISEILILLPSLQALKGNLHMTLASRMSTHSHMGQMNDWDELRSLAIANIALNQILSTTIGILASALAIIIHAFLSYRMFELDDALLVMVTGVLTCSIASVFLDIIMIFVIYGAQVYKIDPDDVATPIAASLGDITSLSLYAFLAKALYDANAKGGDNTVFNIVCFSVIILYVLLLPVWFSIVKDNVHTADVMCRGSYWYPLISAMFVCTICGLILDASLVDYSGIALFHPVICGVGGNLVAIQSSKLSSYLHAHTKPGQLPKGETVCMNPVAICLRRPTYKTTPILLIIAIPGHILFFFICSYVSGDGAPPMTFLFLISYVVAAELQVFILLYLAYVITYALWLRCIDPDNATIPYLTSIGDVIGATFITIIFISLNIRHQQEEG